MMGSDRISKKMRVIPLHSTIQYTFLFYVMEFNIPPMSGISVWFEIEFPSGVVHPKAYYDVLYYIYMTS